MSQGPAAHFVRQLQPISGHGQQDITAELRRAILSGRVRPGSLVAIHAVAEFFGVSPIPVREALKTLVGEGLVEHRGRAGYHVTRFGFSELEELYIACQALELAAIPRALALAGPDDDLRLRSAFRRSQSAIRADEAIELQAATKDFHFALVAPARMTMVDELLERVWNLTEPGQPMQHNDRERRTMLQKEHADQLDAFLTRDAELLHRLTIEHYDTLFETIAGLPMFDKPE
ncbi:MAG: GntR family transcriptional regulator [Gordonia sp. (in: high G+C Gram-positive bacteria)]|uniref:GntR family transcriptional regulator n=1 Tax=Gordonia sp. (in: high G+C Gram-positive bacteria) TaxID=84139 RepID=UPI0039E627A5